MSSKPSHRRLAIDATRGRDACRPRHSNERSSHERAPASSPASILQAAERQHRRLRRPAPARAPPDSVDCAAFTLSLGVRELGQEKRGEVANRGVPRTSSASGVSAACAFRPRRAAHRRDPAASWASSRSALGLERLLVVVDGALRRCATTRRLRHVDVADQRNVDNTIAGVCVRRWMPSASDRSGRSCSSCSALVMNCYTTSRAASRDQDATRRERASSWTICATCLRTDKPEPGCSGARP